MKIAVTGSEGFIGTNLVNKLKDLNYKIFSIDYKREYDLTRDETLKKIPRFDVVIHLAALTYVPESFNNPKYYLLSNYLSTLNVLELCRKYKAKMIFNSSYVYGVPKYLPIDENHSLEAHNPYSQSKIICEELCKCYNRDFKVPIIIIRPFNIYGNRQDERFLIPKIIKQISTGTIILDNPKPKRDFIHIDDVVSALIKTLHHNKSSLNIFNLGSGYSYSVKNVAEIISGLVEDKLKIKYKQKMRPNEVLNVVCDNKKIASELDWKPEISLKEGLNMMINLSKTRTKI